MTHYLVSKIIIIITLHLPNAQTFSVETLACDHTKVTPLFIESIVTKKGYWAYPCPTLLSYILNICDPKDEDYVLMGEYVTRK